MKKLILILMVLILLNPVYAARVGVITRFKDSTEENWCVITENGATAKDALDATDLDLDWSGLGSGAYLNTVNGIPPDYANNKGWSFWHQNSNGNCFELSIVGFGGYTVTTTGTIIGLSYSSYDPITYEFLTSPTFISYDELCPEMFQVNISKIYVDGEKQKESNVRGGKIKDLFPGSKIELKIELENLYDSSTDIEIVEVSIKGTIEEIDNGEDIEEEIVEFDLKADMKVSKSLKFEIPLEVEAKDRLLKIEIKAKDDAGIKYEKEINYDLEIEKEDHKLKIAKADLDKSSYKCGTNALLDFSIINIGAKNEEVKVKIVNKDLSLNINKEFELSNNVFEESSKYENRFNIYLPNNISVTTYPITITADYGSEKEIKNINLIVSECEKKEIKNETKESKEEEEITGVQIEQSPKEEKIEAGKEELKETTTIEEETNKILPFVLTAVLGILVVIIVVLVLIFWVVRK